ncbi:MAG: hypothetical protein BWY21_01091 [Parcubacteria group bacterium ADurb.Bin216]|nr:MAG: hypothetical protein BWY21_01091 [Parcubacteria group bacterium ADurb.Bin216]
MKSRRLSIEISEEEQIRMRNLIPWGVVSRIMRLLLIQTMDLVERHGDVVLGALVSGKLTSLDLLRKEDSKDGHKRSKSKYK